MHSEVMENRGELRDLLLSWLGCAVCASHVQAVATSAWALLQV